MHTIYTYRTAKSDVFHTDKQHLISPWSAVACCWWFCTHELKRARFRACHSISLWLLQRYETTADCWWQIDDRLEGKGLCHSYLVIWVYVGIQYIEGVPTCLWWHVLSVRERNRINLCVCVCIDKVECKIPTRVDQTAWQRKRESERRDDWENKADETLKQTKKRHFENLWRPSQRTLFLLLSEAFQGHWWITPGT